MKNVTWFKKLQALARICMFKGFTDKKLDIFYGNVNYKNMIYYILFVFRLYE